MIAIFLERRNVNTNTQGQHQVMTEAATGVTATARPGTSRTEGQHYKLGRDKEDSEEAWFHQHLFSDFVSRTMTE